jgi:hypothetical protein
LVSIHRVGKVLSQYPVSVVVLLLFDYLEKKLDFRPGELNDL